MLLLLQFVQPALPFGLRDDSTSTIAVALIASSIPEDAYCMPPGAIEDPDLVLVIENLAICLRSLLQIHHTVRLTWSIATPRRHAPEIQPFMCGITLSANSLACS